MQRSIERRASLARHSLRIGDTSREVFRNGRRSASRAARLARAAVCNWLRRRSIITALFGAFALCNRLRTVLWRTAVARRSERPTRSKPRTAAASRRGQAYGPNAPTSRRCPGVRNGLSRVDLALVVGPSRSVAAERQPIGRARQQGVLIGGSMPRTRSNVTTSVPAGCRPSSPLSRRRSGLGSGRSFRPATRGAMSNFAPRLCRLLNLCFLL